MPSATTWNPQLSQIKKTPGATEVFDSSKIPNEIQDIMSVSTPTLKANPALGKVVQLWHLRAELYHVVAVYHSQHEAERRLAELNGHFPTRAPRSGFVPLLS